MTTADNEAQIENDDDFDLADLLPVEDGDAPNLPQALHDELACRIARPAIESLSRRNARDKMKALRRQSIDRRESGKRTFGPFLRVREAVAGERGAVIVIQDGDKQKRTGIKAKAGVAEEDHEGALAALAKYVDDTDRRKTVEQDPDSIPLDVLFNKHLATLKPEKLAAGYDRLTKTFARAEAANWWLVEFGKGKTIAYVDDDFGKNYKRWRLQQKARVTRRKDERRDPAIEKEQYLAKAAFAWLSKKLRKARAHVPDLSFEIQKSPKKQKKSLTWTEVEWLLLACLGFQREGRSYKKKIEVRRGVERVVWDRLDCSQTKWLIRFFLTYLCTGTRFSRNRKLLWGVNDGVGSLDRDGKAIWRNGRQEELNNRKIAGRSPLTPLFKAIVRKWFAKDMALSRTWGFDPIYVVHDGKGNPLPNIDTLVLEVFRRAGLEQSAHILKHTLVTLFGLAGATSDEIEDQTNTDKDTIEDTYTWVEWFENKLERRNGRAEISRLIELKHASPQPILPEIAAAAVAKLGRNGGAECRI